jgi:hypothetical protein
MLHIRAPASCLAKKRDSARITGVIPPALAELPERVVDRPHRLLVERLARCR